MEFSDWPELDHPEPVSVVLGTERSEWPDPGCTPALSQSLWPWGWTALVGLGFYTCYGGLAQVGVGQVIRAGTKCSSKEIGVLPAEGGMDLEQAREQAWLCDTEASLREGSGQIEPPLHPPLPEVMVGMGYTREEIKEALTSQKYNEVTATYLLLGRKTEVRRRQGHLGCAMPGVEGLWGQRGQRR